MQLCVMIFLQYDGEEGEDEVSSNTTFFIFNVGIFPDLFGVVRGVIFTY